MLASTILLTERLDQLAATTPLATAVDDGAMTLTYAGLRDQIAARSLALRRRGVRPMDRVAILLPNGVEWVVALFACLRLGAVAVPLSPDLNVEERERIFRDCDPCLALVDGGLTGILAVPSVSLPSLLATEGPAEARPGEAMPCPAPEDLAVLLYTSGTTARPKGVMHLHGRLARAAARRAAWLALTPGDRLAALTTLAHALGLTGGVFTAMSVGAVLLLPPLRDPSRMISFLQQERATFALGTPWVYASLVTDVGAAYDLGALRRCYSGGGALSDTVMQAFACRYGVELRQMCGMTELPGYCAIPGGAANRPGSIGMPNPGIELRLLPVEVREDAVPGAPRAPRALEPVPTGQVGEIWVRSDVATVGYWNNAAATAALLKDGWIRTGDLAWADADGYLYFVGRRAAVRST